MKASGRPISPLCSVARICGHGGVKAHRAARRGDHGPPGERLQHRRHRLRVQHHRLLGEERLPGRDRRQTVFDMLVGRGGDDDGIRIARHPFVEAGHGADAVQAFRFRPPVGALVEGDRLARAQRVDAAHAALAH